MGLKGDIVEKRGFCSVEWKIKDFFSTSPLGDEVWSSPSFHLSNALWCLDLYPNGETNHKSVGWISIYLNKKESETKIHEISFVLGVKANDGTEIKSDKDISLFNKPNVGYGWTKFYELKELQREKDELFPDGAVTFFCQARVIGGENGVDAESQTDNRSNFCGLSENFKDLFLNEAGADVTIKVKDKEFRAHSQVLSARSSVLAAMFRHDTMEKNSGVVEIPEYDSDTFKEFLIFVYSGQAEELTSENVVVLYSAADKYDMEELKTRCSEFMKENMSVDTICSFLSVAITYDDKDLIDFSTNFFVENVKSILVTAEWKSFIEQHPVQSTELFILITQRFVPDKTTM